VVARWCWVVAVPFMHVADAAVVQQQQQQSDALEARVGMQCTSATALAQRGTRQETSRPRHRQLVQSRETLAAEGGPGGTRRLHVA
jgi:hypothetical protein